jgi:hypothetical protein
MVDSTPNTPSSVGSNNSEVKVATPDIILFNDDAMPIDIIPDLIFEDIGGQELINLSRNDIINGITVAYQPIKNLSAIYQQYNSKNIIDIQNTSDTYFKNFSIKFESKIPIVGSGPSGQTCYIDSSGNLIIEVANLEADEQVEIQFLIDGHFFNDTI